MTQGRTFSDRAGNRGGPAGRLTGGLVLALILGLLATPASADSTVVIHGFPAGWWSAPATPQMVGVSGPSGAPLGSGSLRIAEGQAMFNDFAAPASTLGAFGGFVRLAQDSTVVVQMWLDTSPETVTTIDDAEHVLYASVANTPSSWDSFDLQTQTWTVEDRTPEPSEPPTRTWQSYLDAHPGAVLVSAAMYFIETAPSDPKAPLFYYLDGLRFGASGSVTTYNFEVAPVWPLTTTASASRVTFGNSLTVSGTLQNPDGVLQAGVPLMLYKRAYGESAYASTGVERTTGGDGRVAVTRTPAKRTLYQWRPTDHFERNVVAKQVAVEVRRVITANVQDATITASTPLVLGGLTRPVAKGATVTLRRVGSTTALATARVHADGTYALAKTLPRGTWSVYTTVPASNGLLGGTSSKREITVR